MKKIVYLFGAGATQAETDFGGSNAKVLTTQIKDGIQIQLDNEPKSIKKLVSNDLLTSGVDIEQLISLYESRGTEKGNKAAYFLRKSFMSEIVRNLKIVDTPDRKFQPTLMSALFELHKEHEDILDEQLIAILTLNYDDFAERAIKAVYSGVNYGFATSDLLGKTENSNTIGEFPALLKLHGSFNWANDFPPTIVKNPSTNPDKCLWIPPGVDKRKEKYPFNILWGRAKEVLDCDVLRVIGCSLSRNDWQLISLLHSSERVSNLKIEYIDFEDVGKQKKIDYPYLGIDTILAIEGFKKHLTDQTGIREPGKSIEDFAETGNAAKFNCFHKWLEFKKTMLEIHKGVEFNTSQYIKQI